MLVYSIDVVVDMLLEERKQERLLALKEAAEVMCAHCGNPKVWLEPIDGGRGDWYHPQKADLYFQRYCYATPIWRLIDKETT